MIRKFDTVCLKVSDAEKTSKWYKEIITNQNYPWKGFVSKIFFLKKPKNDLRLESTSMVC